MERMGDRPIFPAYSDDNEKNAFNNSGNTEHRL